MKKNRYKLKREDELLFETSSIRRVAAHLGCTEQHIHKYIKDGKFSYKKIIYTIIDKLDEN